MHENNVLHMLAGVLCMYVRFSIVHQGPLHNNRQTVAGDDKLQRHGSNQFRLVSPAACLKRHPCPSRNDLIDTCFSNVSFWQGAQRPSSQLYTY